MIRGTRELLFAVLRDIVFTRNEIIESGRFDLDASDGITNAVFHIVRNAQHVAAAGRGEPGGLLGWSCHQPD